MAILKERKTWKRKPAPSRFEALNTLTATEQENVRRAVKVLSILHGSTEKLALAVGIHRKSITRALGARSRPQAGLAIRLARVAGVKVDDILSGGWPHKDGCPMCGRE